MENYTKKVTKRDGNAQLTEDLTFSTIENG